jgi:galactokinase
MTGGGFGGSAIALARADALDGIRAAVTEAFAAAGATAPAYLVATPSDAARVDRLS